MNTISGQLRSSIRQLRRRDTSEGFFDTKWGGSKQTQPGIYKFRLTQSLEHCGSAAAVLFRAKNDVETDFANVVVRDPTGQVQQQDVEFAAPGWLGTCYRENGEYHIIEIGPPCNDSGSGSGSSNQCIDIVTAVAVIGCNIEVTRRQICLPDSISVGAESIEQLPVPCCCDSGCGCGGSSGNGETQIGCLCTATVDDGLNSDVVFSWLSYPDFLCKGSEYTFVFRDFGTHTNTTDHVTFDITVVGSDITITDDGGGTVIYPNSQEAVLDFGTTTDRTITISFELVTEGFMYEDCLAVNVEGGTFPDVSTVALQYNSTTP